MRPPSLTRHRLVAIIEALHLRLAGVLDHDGRPFREDYQDALAWAEAQLDRRDNPPPIA